MEPLIHNPGNYLIIKTITAFVSVDEDGNEGILGTNSIFPGHMMPLIGADEERITSLYPLAKEISEITGVPFKVIQLSSREDITEKVKMKFEKKNGAN